MQVDEKARPPRELVWNEYHDEQGNPDRWDAETPFNTYYGISLLLDGYSVQHDYTDVAKQLESLDEAKEAAAADCVKRCTAYLAALGEREPVASADEDELLTIAYMQGAHDAVKGGGKFKYPLKSRVTKTKGSSWTGRVVGFYSTTLTPIGYAVESENEPGSVQIYPEAALDAAGGRG